MVLGYSKNFRYDVVGSLFYFVFRSGMCCKIGETEKEVHVIS